jgi:hypothetical protein
VTASRGHEFPHFDSFIQTSRNKILSIRSESDRVDTILMPIRALETLDKVTRSSIPNADAFVKRPCRNKLGIGRDSDSSHAVFYTERENILSCLNVP